MPNKVVSSIRRKLKHFRVLETGVSLMMLMWCVVLWLPGSTFSSGTSYLFMQRTASEFWWGLSCGIVGSAQLIGMILRRKWLRRSAHLFATGFWLQTATMILAANVHATGWPVYYIVGIFNGYLYWRTGEAQ